MITSTFWHIIGWSFGVFSTLGYLIICYEGKQSDSDKINISKVIYFLTGTLGWAMVFGIK